MQYQKSHSRYVSASNAGPSLLRVACPVSPIFLDALSTPRTHISEPSYISFCSRPSYKIMGNAAESCNRFNSGNRSWYRCRFVEGCTKFRLIEFVFNRAAAQLDFCVKCIMEDNMRIKWRIDYVVMQAKARNEVQLHARWNISRAHATARTRCDASLYADDERKQRLWAYAMYIR